MLKRSKIFAKGAEAPSMPAPAAAPPPPTMDDSEEVKKQRLLEEQRQARAAGYSSTEKVEEGVPLQQENIDKKTLLGE